eukprot:9250652-Alexandrium_andersonii.AAC.1
MEGAWAHVYRDRGEPGPAATAFLAKYGHLLPCKPPEPLEPISGRQIISARGRLPAAALGLDHWAPAELRVTPTAGARFLASIY